MEVPSVTSAMRVLELIGKLRTPLGHPPGERMAEALTEVRHSLQRNLEAKKGGPRRTV